MAGSLRPDRAAIAAVVAPAALLTAAALVSPAGTQRALAQVQPIKPPMHAGERITAGEDIGRYRALYGTPEFRALDDEGSRPWPRLQNIRTVGSFAEIPGKGRAGSVPPQLGRVLEFDSRYTSHMVCGQMRCLAIMPVPELRDFFYQVASSWQYQDVEIIGAFDNAATPTPRQQDPPTWAFQVWSIALAGGAPTRRAQPSGPTLESLVRGPEATAGRAITVSGVFRGANLFGDLPAETRRQPSDWVLQDGPYSVWVTGKAPRGSGWSLDPRSRGDCGFRLQVRGRVESAGGYVYLRAKSVVLLGRARERGDGAATEPPR
jgi:hypothetical protein